MGPTIEQDIWIDASIDLVWRTVTEPDLVARWFADQVDVQPTPGADGSLTFTGRTAGTETGRSTTVRVAVQSVEPPRRFSYRWLHPEGAPARAGNSVLVTFVLAAEGTGTRLRVVETEVAEMGWARDELENYAAEHNGGWVAHLGRLRDDLAGQHAEHP
jgi:uncharacterized protein YndB with AHSA1/START domain